MSCVHGSEIGEAEPFAEAIEIKVPEDHPGNSTALLKLACRVGRIGAWVIDLPDLTVFWSDEVCLIHEVPPGYSPKISESTRFISPEYHAAVGAAFERCVREGVPFDMELQITTAKGRRLWVRTISEVERDPNGDVCRVQGILQDISKEKQATMDRLASEKEFTNAFEFSSIGKAFVSPQGRWIRVNRALRQMLGYSAEELLAKTFQEITHPDDLKADLENLRQMLAGMMNTYQTEKRYLDKQGRFVWVLLNVSIVFNQEGQPAYFITEIQDLSERKSSEAELLRVNRALEMLYRGNKALIHSNKESELLASVCQAAVEVGEYPLVHVSYVSDDASKSITPQASAGVGQDYQDYVDELKLTWDENTPNGKGPIGRCVRTGQPQVLLDVTQDRHFFPWIQGAQVRGYQGVVCLPLKEKERVLGVITFYLPTESSLSNDEFRLQAQLAEDLAYGIQVIRSQQGRRQAEERLREQASLLENTQDAITVRDLDHRLTYWNRSAGRMYGWTSEEALGCHHRELLKIDLEDFRRADETLRETGKWHGETDIAAKDGTLLRLDTRWTLLLDSKNRPKSILTIDTDITEQKKLEKQLLRAQRIESIGTLAGGMAHDLNNVLAPILMALKMLRLGERSEKRLKVLATIEASAHRGGEMISQVLSFARGVEVQSQKVNVNSLLHEVERITNKTFLKNIQMRLVADPRLWPVLGDPTQLHQVLLNLCVNARDAMPEGGNLTLSAKNIILDSNCAELDLNAKAGPYVVIEVEDTGHGIPQDIIDKVFDPFFTTKELGKGTGLGLSTSLGIVRAHGGSIQLRSRPDQGTNFLVYLPAQISAIQPEELSVDPEVPQGQGEWILLADDEDAARQITQETLETFGYRVLLAADGEEALSLYRQRSHEIAVLVTDMMMPNMDGLKLIETVRQSNPQLPIIAVSGLPTLHHRSRASLLGVQRFLAKPFLAEGLLQALHEVLRSEGTKQEA